jgi:hypothetical protein
MGASSMQQSRCYHDYTPKDKRKGMVETCMKSLINDSSCVGKYQSTDVLKPYLAELVDQGKIKDEDGVIKKFYKRGIVYVAGPIKDTKSNDSIFTYLLTPPMMRQDWQPITEEIKSSLASTWNKTRDDIEKGVTQPCLPIPNACDDAKLAYSRDDDSKKKIEACLRFLTDHNGCLERHKHDISVAPYLNQLIDEQKILSVDGKINEQLPADALKANQKQENAVQPRESSPDDSEESHEAIHPIGELGYTKLGENFNKWQNKNAKGEDFSCPSEGDSCVKPRQVRLA